MYYLEPMSGLSETVARPTKILVTTVGAGVGATLGGGGVVRRIVFGAAGAIASYVAVSVILRGPRTLGEALYDANPLRPLGERLGDRAAQVVHGPNVTIADSSGWARTGYDAQAERHANQPSQVVERQNRDTAREYFLATGAPDTGRLPSLWQGQNRAYRWNEESSELLAIPYDEAVRIAARVLPPQTVTVRVCGFAADGPIAHIPVWGCREQTAEEYYRGLGPKTAWDEAWYYNNGDLSDHPSIIARHP